VPFNLSSFKESVMREKPLLKVKALGQSIWLDYIRRDLMKGGELKRMIENDALSGMTSNPAIFEKAIAGSDLYNNEIAAMVKEGRDPGGIYDELSIRDVGMAADEFRRVYDGTDGRDGFVSLEVNPHLARDTEGTVKEAERLWRALNRPNVCIKVPGTAEGLPAITRLASKGINLNVTLLFSVPRYRAVAEAWIAGLEERAGRGLPIDKCASVASFFVSRIDSLIDPKLEKAAAHGGAEVAKEALGNVAVASAKAAYRVYKEVFATERFGRLVKKGARAQRLLWASTGVKNPAFSDVKYVDSLIGPDTVNTVPSETLDAYRDHGDPALRLESDVPDAVSLLDRLPEAGIDLEREMRALEEDGVAKFKKAFDALLNAIRTKR
jgi:transaldolase